MRLLRPRPQRERCWGPSRGRQFARKDLLPRLSCASISRRVLKEPLRGAVVMSRRCPPGVPFLNLSQASFRNRRHPRTGAGHNLDLRCYSLECRLEDRVALEITRSPHCCADADDLQTGTPAGCPIAATSRAPRSSPRGRWRIQSGRAHPAQGDQAGRAGTKLLLSYWQAMPQFRIAPALPNSSHS